MSDAPLIGILALQGCVQPHRRHLEAAGARVRELRAASDFADLDGLLVPGGESTTMLKLLDKFGLEDCFLATAVTRPYWGVCAGAILAASDVRHPAQRSFGVVDAQITRNAYGRQTESFNAEVAGAEVSFIRAPVIDRVGPGVVVRAEREGKAVWVSQGMAWLMTFHPELSVTAPSPFHRDFVGLVRAARLQRQTLASEPASVSVAPC